jgi:predicted RecB family nuclease
MDFKSDSNIAKTINYILDINRNKKNIIRVDDLQKTNNWRKNDDFLEIYMDFETLNGNIGQVDIGDINSGFIFMAGIGWDEENEFKFKSFILDKKTDIDEYNMISTMWDFIDIKKKELNKKQVKLIHYSHAEISFYKIFKNKHNKVIDINNFNRLDLHKVFLDNNVIIKGALNFSLKTIAKAMNKYKMIETKWDNDMNGLNAMMLAYNIYNSVDNVDINNDIMKDIIKYNMIDCKVMWEILLYLRTNY